MESTDNPPETLQDLKARRNALSAELNTFMVNHDALVTHEEKMSLARKFYPSSKMLKDVISKISKIEKQEQTASPNLTAKESSSHGSQADLPTGTEAKPDESKHGEHNVATATHVNDTAVSSINDKQKADAVNATDGKPLSPVHATGNHKGDEPEKHPVTDSSSNDWGDGTAGDPANVWDQAPPGPPIEEEAPVWNPAEPDPPWIADKTHVTMKKPKRSNPTDPAVLRFITGDKVYCIGHLDKTVEKNVVQVLPIIKCPRTEPPYYGIRVKFPRDKSSEATALFNNPKFHTVLYKFLPKSYTVEDHLVIDEAEFQEFLEHAPSYIHAKAKEAKSQEKLYRITFSYDEKGIEQLFYPNLFSSSVPGVQDIFNAMELVPACKTLSIFMWKYTNIPNNLQFLYRTQWDHVSSLDPYLHREKMGLAAYVQWGKIKIPKAEDAFDRWQTFHKYPEYHLIVGNGVAREKMKELEIIKQLRNHPAKMTVHQVGPGGTYYIALMQFHKFKDAKKVIVAARQGLVTWEPAPKVKPQNELAQGERPAQDRPHGWPTWVITESSYLHGADMAFWLKRPTDATNKYKDKEMPDVPKVGEGLQSQMVYYKIRVDVTTTKQLLDGLNKLRFKETKGDPDAEIKRALICGGDQKIYRKVNVLEGLSDADIKSFAWSLTPSQEDFIFHYCRQILNGIGILQGPAGSGKTTIIKILVQIANKRGLKVAVVTDSNSAADNVIDVLAGMPFVAVRVHPAGLERHHLMRHVRKGIDRKSLKPADPELPPKSSVGDELAEKPWVDSFNRHGDIKDSGMEDVITGPSDDHDDPDNFMDATDQVTNAIDAADEDAQRAEGWQHDDLSVTFTEYMLKSAQDNYANAKAIMSPEDPRMRMIDSALWTWMLKVLHVIKKDPNAHVVNIILDQLAAKEEWQELRAILMKSQVQELNNAQQAMYVDLIKKCAAMFISIAASATVCTIAQLASQLLKGVLFDWIIVDEAIVMTEAQFIEIWRNSSLVILLGDQAQFGSTVLTKPFENPFVDQLRQGPFVRLIQNGWPYFMLREVMRMTSGLELICSDLFYNGKLKSGTGTELYLPSRAMSRKWQEITLSKYPSLKKEPQGLVYPIFIDIVSESEQELGGGTSWTNLFTASAIIDYVIWLVESEIAKPDEIGIATPYAAQVNLYLEQFRQLDKPNHVWELIRVGSTEWWQGKQAYCMIVDLVRASSDMADLGFMADARRLNVLHSRQTQALTIFGDKDCVKTGSTGNQEADEKESKKRNYDNRFLIQLFKWMQNRGRLVEIPAESLSQQYVKPTARAPPARAPVSAPAPGPASTSGPASTTDWDSSSNAAADAGAAWKSRENTWS